MKWLAQTTIYRDSVDLLLVDDRGSEGRSVGVPIIFEMHTHERHMPIEAPTLELSHDSARSLLQALWDAGIRPVDWSSPHAEVKAMRAHVEFAEHVTKSLLSR